MVSSGKASPGSTARDRVGSDAAAGGGGIVSVGGALSRAGLALSGICVGTSEICVRAFGAGVGLDGIAVSIARAGIFGMVISGLI